MSTNLKTKKENWTGEEVAVLLEEVHVEKSKPYLFEIATRMLLKGHGHLHTCAGSCHLRKIVKRT